MNQEDEIKVTGPNAEGLIRALDAIMSEYSLRAESDETTQRESRYLDSVRGTLSAAGIGLRVRVGRGEVFGLWTAKVRDRVESGRFLSVEVQEGGDYRTIPSPLAAGVRKLVGSDPLCEIARFITTRRALDMVAPTGARVEISLDEVEVEFPAPLHFYEMEIENRTATSALLVDLGDCAVRTGLRYCVENKLGRALGVGLGGDPDPRQAALFLAACRGSGDPLVAPWSEG